MPFKIKNKQLRKLIKNAVAASRDGAREICGLIIDTGYSLELIQVKNKIKAGGGFRFYIPEIKKIEKAGSAINYEIVGSFHSHPLYIAQPGEMDLADVKDNELMLIIDCMDKEAKLWKIKGGKANKVKFELI